MGINIIDYFAHSLPQQPESRWQHLDGHLSEVSLLARDFAAAFGAGEWGRLAGIWHDLGKYSVEFQAYLRRKNGFEAHIENAPGRVDHSTAGAQHAVRELNLPGHLLAYVIAGHHSGLLDGRSEFACQEDRLKKTVYPWTAAPENVLHFQPPVLPTFLAKALGEKNGFAVSFFVRMVLSCLADADFLDTERFMNPEQAALRTPLPDDTLDLMESALDEHVRGLAADDAPVNADRAMVRAACLKAAAFAPGFFSLTVPTGGGKTLSSLAFALRHARTHGLNRVIYVLPFTSIIEQNADEFREVMNLVPGIPGDRLVIEHHSNFDPEKETPYSRLACENWNVPLTVTTSVQFYESLFGNRTSVCRKLHNLARAVIILDEAQTIPVEYLQPCLQALRELTENYGATVVLCTATQPAVHMRPDFAIGIRDVREIIPDPPGLYRRLKRVNVEDLGMQSDADIGSRLLEEEQVLCIVNTRGHARSLTEALGEDDGHFHLSALMCPAHRSRALVTIRQRLKDGLRCRVVSTQLVEAGVDVDFPVVFRSMTGLDSIVQAAGRCNRNGRLSKMGRAYIFRSEHQDKERFLADTANCAAQVLDLHPGDPLALEAVEHYFKLYYWDQAARWDTKKILQSFHLIQDRGFPFQFDFARVGRDFLLIAEDTRPVIIPWGEEGRHLCTMLRAMPGLNREIARRLQRYSVQIRTRSWMKQLNHTIEPVLNGSLAILTSTQLHYSDAFGLHLDNPSGDALIA